MFQTAIANLVADFNRKLCANGASYVLVYADTDALGRMSVRCSSNYPQEKIGALLGSLLEAGDTVKQMLADLFKAHPMRLPAQLEAVSDGVVPPAADAPPAFVEIPTEQAIIMVLDALMTNLQLRGAKPESPILLPG
jgi:hypothetical protein